MSTTDSPAIGRRKALASGIAALIETFIPSDTVTKIEVADDRGGTGTWKIKMTVAGENPPVREFEYVVAGRIGRHRVMEVNAP